MEIETFRHDGQEYSVAFAPPDQFRRHDADREKGDWLWDLRYAKTYPSPPRDDGRTTLTYRYFGYAHSKEWAASVARRKINDLNAD